MYSVPNMTNVARLVPKPQPAELVRVVIAGSDALARAGLASIAGAFDDIVVIDELDADAQLTSRLRLLAPDVVVCDINVDASLIHQIDTPVLALLTDDAHATDAISSGARGAIARTASPRRLHAAMRAIHEGLLVVDRDEAPARMLHAEPLSEPLTAREQEVLELLASGLTNKEIATRLGITDHTVKFHVNAILGKLGAETRTEAVVHAARLGIVVL